MHAIQTYYKGIRFRSRLEATWAAFFDLCGWQWEYEPCDFAGWIPDFELTFENEVPVYVEVKPWSSRSRVVQEKAWEGCGWLGGHALLLVLGTGPHMVTEDADFATIGWLWGLHVGDSGGYLVEGDPLEATSARFEWWCRAWALPSRASFEYVFRFWAQAKNTVQWKGAHAE